MYAHIATLNKDYRLYHSKSIVRSIHGTYSHFFNDYFLRTNSNLTTLYQRHKGGNGLIAIHVSFGVKVIS